MDKSKVLFILIIVGGAALIMYLFFAMFHLKTTLDEFCRTNGYERGEVDNTCVKDVKPQQRIVDETNDTITVIPFSYTSRKAIYENERWYWLETNE